MNSTQALKVYDENYNDNAKEKLSGRLKDIFNSLRYLSRESTNTRTFL